MRHRLAESSENRHARSCGLVTMIDQLTESPTADVPSPNPLDLLSLRQLVVFLARAHQRPLTELAELLGLSRETVHLETPLGRRKFARWTG